MMTTTTGSTMTTTDPVEAEARRPLARRIAGGVRTRILASYVILLAITAAASVVAVRQVLLVRLDDRVEEDLQCDHDSPLHQTDPVFFHILCGSSQDGMRNFLIF